MEPLDALRRALATKAAHDNGWELPPAESDGRLHFGSARFQATAEVGAIDAQGFAARFSDLRLVRELERLGYPYDASGAIVLDNDQALDRLMRRAAQIALSLPDAPLHEYRRLAAAAKIEATEAERLVKQRIGQSVYRKALLALWDGRCAVTGLAAQELLRASHARPWAMCESDQQRLDPFNGLLLTPNLDALFDDGWISFEDDGVMIVSPLLDAAACAALIDGLPDRLRWVAAEHWPYLAFHRDNVFRRTVNI